MTKKTDRWSFEDNTGVGRGYCRILLDGMDIGIDVFPFRKGADPATIKAYGIGLVEVLNAAEYWRRGSDGLGPECLEDAVDAFRKLRDGASRNSTEEK